MSYKIKEFYLPEWAFLDAHSHLGNELEGRTVIFHIRSCTVMEAFAEGEYKNITFNNDVLSYHFEYKNFLGIIEKHLLVVHFCTTLNILTDSSFILENILKPTAEFYCKNMEWEDNNINMQDLSELN